ncbi:hypothetical protein PHYPO_G00097030 [Pangasianodon hypophthalmus]|uniref:DOMON domain-containing protein n=1 Tax=Pangasianodon hypophthalmus TaxID=310915 RepID=A0A5N5LBR0_PANHP|nr:hypothetical protein PHYPO_G00097030 [Pangasianodon hypophthalmus]
MMSVPALLMLLVWFLGQTSGADVDPTLPFSEYLDSNTNVLLRWGFDVVRDTITFEVTVNTTGWVGFGFSPNGGMAGSDIVIGGVGPGGIYFTDRNAAGNFMPALDQKQDYKVLSLTEANGQTVMKFQRSIKACDENDFSITEMPVKLIYAYGNTDDIGYHKTLRGTKEVNLLSYMPRTSIPDSKYFDLTMTNIEPVIQNKDIVHHLLLYRCPPSVTKPSGIHCSSSTAETRNRVLGHLPSPLNFWGVGGGAFEFPEVAGLPVGGDGNGTLYRLEVHYNNQYKTAGLVDNSGLRFYYTAQLRQFDAAVLQTGLLVTIGFEYAIPPNATSFLTYGLCDTSYLPQVLSQSPKDLQVFAVILHTHLTGRKVRVGHFRDGEQIDFLALNEHYDFEFQQVTHLGKTKTVKLGDQLLVECTYNTNNRTELTWGGLETHNEMCLAFLYYYPALDLSTCSSLPHKKTLMTEMGAANATDWMNMMKTKVWDNNSVLEYQQTLKRIQQYILVGSLENIVLNTGKIPELKLSPSSSCLRSRAEIQSPGTVILLLGLMLSLILL